MKGKHLLRPVIVSWVFILLFAASAMAENLALAKKYTWTMEPNYARSQTVLTNLTDGKLALEKEPRRMDPFNNPVPNVPSSEGGIWTDKATVSWCSNNPVVGIVFDLEKISPIGQVRFYTQYSDASGIFLPALIVGVGNDGVKFKQVAAWTPGPMKQKGIHRYCITVDNFKAAGRYVKVIAFGIRGFMMFTDEVEILRGHFEPSSISMDQYPELSMLPEDLRKVVSAAAWASRMSVYVADARDRLHAGRFPKSFSSQVAQLAADVQRTLFSDRTVFDKLYREYCTLRGKAAHEEFKSDLVLWPKNPWVGYDRHQIPESPPKWDQVLNISMMINEYESYSFMLSNTSGFDRTYKVQVGPAKGEPSWPSGTLVLREGYFAQDMDFNEVSDVLPLVVNNQVTVPAGQSREIWLTLKTKDAKPGLHHLEVKVIPEENTAQAKQVQVQVTVYPIRFPDTIPLTCMNWTYICNPSKVFANSKKEAVADLFAHYNNTFILGGGDSWPLPEVDAAGNIVKPLNFERLDREVRLLQGARRISWFLGWGDAGRSAVTASFPGAPLKYMSPEWKKAYREWITRIVAHLKSLGLDYSQFFYYPIDEAATPSAIELFKLTKSIDPKLMVFCNAEAAVDNEAVNYADIIEPAHCPVRGWCEDRLSIVGQKLRKTRIKEFWTYSCGDGVRSYSPYTYYRLMPWRTWFAGGNGCGFFYYADHATDSLWSIDHVDYGVVYDARTAPADVPRTEAFIPSRRWEAWREGIEDYTYLYLLDALIKRAKTNGTDAAKVKKAEATLARVVQEVLAGENDTYAAAHPDRVDYGRERLLCEIVDLSKGREIFDGNSLVKGYRPIRVKEP